MKQLSTQETAQVSGGLAGLLVGLALACIFAYYAKK
jgi:bacteriocin-like protein